MILSLERKYYNQNMSISVRTLQLIFVDKHTLGTERLATGVFNVSALTYKSIYFFSPPQYQANWAKEKSLVKTRSRRW